MRPPPDSAPEEECRGSFANRHVGMRLTDLLVLVFCKDEDVANAIAQDHRARGARVQVVRSLAEARDVVYGRPTLHLMAVQLGPEDVDELGLIEDAMQLQECLTCYAILVPRDVDVAIELLRRGVRCFETIDGNAAMNHVLDAVHEGLRMQAATVLEEFFRAATKVKRP